MTARSKHREMILSAPLTTTLVRMSFPILLTTYMAQLTTVIVMFWMAKKGGVDGLAIFSLFAPVVGCLLFVLCSPAYGSQVLISLSVGAQTGQGMRIFKSILLLTGGMLAIVAVVGTGLSGPISKFLSGDAHLSGLLQPYLLGYVLFALPLLVVVTNLLEVANGSGNPALGVPRLLADLVIIAGLIPLFMSFFGLTGAPLGIGVAAIVFIALLWFAIVRDREKLGLGSMHSEGPLIDWALWKRATAIGLPSQVGPFVTYASFVILTQMAAQDGKLAVAAYGLSLRIIVLCALVTLAIGRANGIIVSQNLGARNGARGINSTKRAAILSLIAVGVVLASWDLFVEPLLGIFTDDEVVLHLSVEILDTMKWALLGVGSYHLLMMSYTATSTNKLAAILLIIAEFLGVTLAFLWDAEPVRAATIGIVAANLAKGLVLFPLIPRSLLRPLRQPQPSES